jgi:hypothetical protein
MKVTINLIESMVMVNSIGNREIYTKEHIKMMRGMDMVKCILLMVQLIKETGLKDYKTEKEH